MEYELPEGRFAKTLYPGDLHETHAVVVPGYGPLLVVIMRTAPEVDDVGVYDAATGAELTWFNTMDLQHGTMTVATHIYEADGRTVLAIAPNYRPVRQRELPSGRPVFADFDPDCESRTMTSYRRDGRTVLVIVDLKGVVRQFDAQSGEALSQPIATRPAVSTTTKLWSRLTGKVLLPPGLSTPPKSIVPEAGTAEPTIVLADFDHGLLRVGLDSGEVVRLDPDPPRRVSEIRQDPRPGSDALLLAGGVVVDGWAKGPGYISVGDPQRGLPAEPTIALDRRPANFCAVPAGAELLIFSGRSQRILRFAGPGFDELPALTVDEPVQDMCAVPIGDRWALFATDEDWTYRFDAVTGEPWPALA